MFELLDKLGAYLEYEIVKISVHLEFSVAQEKYI